MKITTRDTTAHSPWPCLLYTSHMWRVLEGEIGDDFIASVEGSGLVALSWYDAGARNFYNSVRPIERLEDMKGMRIRVQESSLMEDVIRALGALSLIHICGAPHQTVRDQTPLKFYIHRIPAADEKVNP